MFADDYDPNDVPLDQAKGYSYPVPTNPLALPLAVTEEYDDYDPSDVPADQAAPSAYLPPSYDQVTLNLILTTKKDFGPLRCVSSPCLFSTKI